MNIVLTFSQYAAVVTKFNSIILHNASHHRQGKTMMVLASSICKVRTLEIL